MATCDFDTFREVFLPVLAVTRTTVNEKLIEMYFGGLLSLAPTMDEINGICCVVIDQGAAVLPPVEAFKKMLRDRRAAVLTPEQAAAAAALRGDDCPRLPAAPIQPGSPKANAIALLAGIYKHQGDTPFYRNALKGKIGAFSGLYQSAIAGDFGATPDRSLKALQEVVELCHEDVIDYITGVLKC